MRRILHVDMDAFFAAVEQRRHPELRGKPVVVGGRGDPTGRGVVATASYEARRYGIHSAMPLRAAFRRCPEAVFLPVDYEAYDHASRRIKAILREFSPLCEDSGLDEAFLDISAAPGSSEQIAQAIKDRIFADTGLTCSVGVAPNKLLAKLASDMQKPNGLTILVGGEVERRIWPLPVNKLLGVGPKTEQRLARLGVTTIGELAKLSLATLIEQFGQAHGSDLYDAARGIDESPVVAFSEPKSISREVTFERDVADREFLRKTLRRLSREVVAEARAEGYGSRTVATILRYTDFETLSRQESFARLVISSRPVERAALRCLEKIPLIKKARMIGVRISGLAPLRPRAERGRPPMAGAA
jgi:DNA polymerase IV